MLNILEIADYLQPIILVEVQDHAVASLKLDIYLVVYDDPTQTRVEQRQSDSYARMHLDWPFHKIDFDDALLVPSLSPFERGMISSSPRA